MKLTKSLKEEIKNLFLNEWNQYIIDNHYDDPEYDYTKEDKIVALESFAEEWIESHEGYLDAIIENAKSLYETEYTTNDFDYKKYQEAEVILLNYLEEIVEELKKSNLTESLNNLNESYYSIWARNNGMWGGMTTYMKTHGKQIVFTNKEEAQKYLDSIRDTQSYINNFNSYGLEEIKEDVEEDKYTIIVDTVEELVEKEKQLDINEKSQRETAKQNILHLAEVASNMLEGKKLNKADVEPKLKEYGNPELTIYLRDSNYNDIYINVEIQKDDKIQIYCEYKEYVNTIQEAEEKLKDLINGYLSGINIKKESKNMNLRERLEEEYGSILTILQINPDEEDTIGDLLYLDVSGKEIEKIKEVAPLNYAEGIGYNGAPDNDTFLKFLLENPQFEAECYLTTPNRSDYRFEIVGVKADYNDENINILDNFLRNLPGELEEPSEYGEYQKKIRAWWD